MWYLVIALGLIVAAAIAAVVAASRSPAVQNARGALLKKQSIGLLEKGDLEGAIRKDLRALRIFERTGYDRARVATHIALARIYWGAGNLPEVKEHLDVACRDSRKPGYEQFLLEAAELMGEYFMVTRNPREALDCFKEAAAVGEEETNSLRAVTQNVPLPRGRGVIAARPPIEVVFRRVHAILGRANIARAHLTAGDPGQAAHVLRQLLAALDDLEDPSNPRAGTALNTLYHYATIDPTGDASRQLRAVVPPLLRDIRMACTMAAGKASENGESADALERACQELLSFRPQIEQQLRQLRFGPH